jgi:hypothetical protein
MRLTAHRLRSQHLLHHKGHLKGGKKKYNETESYLNQLNNLINASRSDIKKRKKEKRKKKTPPKAISVSKKSHIQTPIILKTPFYQWLLDGL